MQSAPSTDSAFTANFGNGEAGGEACSRGVGKRMASQHTQGLDQGNKRAAFEDITNQHIDAETLNKVLLLKVPERAAHASLQQASVRNTSSRQAPANCAPAQPTPLSADASARAARPTWVDIDCDDVDDQMACAEYAEQIFHNLREKETLRRPCTTYMESVQTDINPAMRSILVDWLVEVGQEYRLASDTLFLAVALIDRYLSLRDVRRNKLQLVGVTAMLIASKYEEIYAPQVEEFCFITDNTYSREDVLEMEREMLHVLNFDITQPSSKTFLRRYIKAASGEIALDVTFEFFCSYLAELTMMDYGLLSFLPSQVAASCTMLALYMLGKPLWSATLTHYSGYSPKELKPCVNAVHALFLGAKTSALPASRDKYASSKYGAVSQLGAPETLPEWIFQ